MARLRLDLVIAAFRAGSEDEAAAEALSLSAAKSILATITIEQVRRIIPLWNRLQSVFASWRQDLLPSVGEGRDLARNVAALDRWSMETMAAVWKFNEVAREALTIRQRAMIAATHSNFPHDSARIVRNVYALLITSPLEFRYVS